MTMRNTSPKQSLRRLAACGLLACMSTAHAQTTVEEANKSNNPLNLAPALTMQNYYMPSIFGTNTHTNDFMLRPTIPIGPSRFIPVPQLFRATVPISTRPDPNGGYQTGLGDINLFDIFLMDVGGGTQFGVGPLLTMPTATDKSLGTGKWQAGLAAVGVHSNKAGVFGALVQWQHSFAGQGDRPTVESLTAQPFIIYNLTDGWYLRSTATWSFDLQRGNYYIPLGLGAGKTWKIGSTIVNAYVEPQYSVIHSGNVPQWQVLGGVSFTFGH